MKTRTVRYLEQGGIESIETDVSEPGAGQVQIECGACGICALDQYAYRHGTVKMGFDPPCGHEGVGYVTKIGPGVKDLKEGDRVAGGSFSRIENVPASDVWPIPDTKKPDELWIVEPVSCCVTGMDTASLRAGDRVALIGCGFMGLILIQGLAHSPLECLVGIDINPKRLDLAKEFGVDEVYDAREKDLGGHLDALKARGFHVVLDMSGTQTGLDLACELVRTGGRLSLFGWHHEERTFSGNEWQLGGYTIVNPSPFGRIRNTFPAAIRLMHKGVFDLGPLVTHVVTLEEFPDFMKRLTAGEVKDYIKGVVQLK